MASQQIEVKGLRELNERMKQFPVKLQKRGVNQAVAAAAKVIVKLARAAAPVDTGAMRRNIKAKKRKPRKLAAYTAIGVEHGKVLGIDAAGLTSQYDRRLKKMVTRRASAREKRGEDPYYFRWVELDHMATGRRKRRKGGSGPVIPGKRFLTNAMTNGAGAALDAMRTRLRLAIDGFSR